MVTYFERYRMMYSITDRDFTPPPAPPAVGFSSWQTSLLRTHAAVKYQAFCNEIDAIVFPCLGRLDGCTKLMHDIASRSNFVPEATVLASCAFQTDQPPTPVATIQGLRHNDEDGAIQNIGVIPLARGRGIAAALLKMSLHGFALAGCCRVYLEVTTQNTSAVRLYHRCGFRHVETLFKYSDITAA